MKITNLQQCESGVVNMEGASGASRQVPIGKADGAPNFSIRVFTLEPGGHTPHHQHRERAPQLHPRRQRCGPGRGHPETNPGRRFRAGQTKRKAPVPQHRRQPAGLHVHGSESVRVGIADVVYRGRLKKEFSPDGSLFRFFLRIQKRLEQVERQREDDRRVLLGGDLGQRL